MYLIFYVFVITNSARSTSDLACSILPNISSRVLIFDGYFNNMITMYHYISTTRKSKDGISSPSFYLKRVATFDGLNHDRESESAINPINFILLWKLLENNTCV
jgi:hypothetical protein